MSEATQGMQLTSCLPEITARRPRVAVLMGTYHGERFLARQLDSIKAQSFTDWALWASDDRASAATVSVLHSYQQVWGEDRLFVRKGPALGFRANFLSLSCDESIQAD